MTTRSRDMSILTEARLNAIAARPELDAINDDDADDSLFDRIVNLAVEYAAWTTGFSLIVFVLKVILS